MLSDDKFNKELKKYDKHLFLGRHLVYRDDEVFNAPCVYYWKHKGLKPEAIKILPGAPCWADLDDIKRMDTWTYEDDWIKKLDRENELNRMRTIASAQDEMNQVSKDVYKLAQKLERYGENG